MKISNKNKVKKSKSAQDNLATEELEDTSPIDLFADLEATLDEVAESNTRLDSSKEENNQGNADLRALLEVSLAITSSLVLDDVLQMVMHKAVELMQAERGLIMLLDDNDELQINSAYNLCREEMMEEDFRIPGSITTQVARSGKPIFASDAQSDDRYAHYKSVQELHLRSIMCVPLTIKGTILGVIYLDNSNQTKMFLKSDLYVFELYAQMVSNALHNANMFNSLLSLERFNESVLDNSPVGIAVINADGQIVTINSVALEILDVNKETVSSKYDAEENKLFLELIPKMQQPRWQTMINTTLATGQTISDPRYYHDTGYLEKVLSLKITPLSDLPNHSDGLIMTLEDVTSKVTMEQYVILSEKLVARGEMAASMAHELNNFLSIISNNAELLSINIEKEQYEKVRFNSKSIVDNIMKIKRFVESLMDFSKPEPEYISYDIRRLIDDLLFTMRIQPRFKLIQFTTNLEEQIPAIDIDVGQIQQIFMNLLNNAADAIEDKLLGLKDKSKFTPTISISASWDDSSKELTVTIKDNGIGMSKETLGKIFGLHFSTKKGGHGLGLYNCLQIAEQHGGTLCATSKKGKGCTFKLTIPAQRAQTANK